MTVKELKGSAHCFFEQSGTFKNEFIKLGIPAFDYDIQDNFGQTDLCGRPIRGDRERMGGAEECL